MKEDCSDHGELIRPPVQGFSGFLLNLNGQRFEICRGNIGRVRHDHIERLGFDGVQEVRLKHQDSVLEAMVFHICHCSLDGQRSSVNGPDPSMGIVEGQRDCQTACARPDIRNPKGRGAIAEIVLDGQYQSLSIHTGDKNAGANLQADPEEFGLTQKIGQRDTGLSLVEKMVQVLGIRGLAQDRGPMSAQVRPQDPCLSLGFG